MKVQIKSNRLVNLQQNAVNSWHDGKEVKATSDFENAVLKQHRFNYDLWHEEDEARRTDVTDGIIAGVKRAIDKLNQNRNDAIEEIDFILLNILLKLEIKPRADSCFNSETVGSVIDRLSILSLRIYHMKLEADRRDAHPDHKKKCKDKLKILIQQKRDLSKAFDELIADIFKGRKRQRIYRQYKMYNDPSLNPAVYKIKS